MERKPEWLRVRYNQEAVVRVLLKMLWRLQQQLQQLRTVLPGQCLADPREALRTQARTPWPRSPSCWAS